ncbi:MAG: CvpA family protein [Legionellaceae bacterium]|nr:CvpA family protein [Legionellaceae bacterium]
MMTLHWIDYAIIALIGLSVFTGLMRGFVKELIALGIWIVAIYLGFTYAPVVSVALKPYIPDTSLRGILSFVALLLGTLICGGLFNMLLSMILNRSGLKGTDRLLGMGFGFARGTFIVALLLGVMNLTSLANTTDFNQSKLYPRFKPLSTWMFSFMPNILEQVRALEKKDEPDAKSKLELKDDIKADLKADFSDGISAINRDKWS